jgi:hypothetical protein
MPNYEVDSNSLPKSCTELAAVWPPTADLARAAGHAPMSPLKAIRLKCIHRSCYQPSEIRQCEAIGCPLWPFRAELRQTRIFKHLWCQRLTSRAIGDKGLIPEVSKERGRRFSCLCAVFEAALRNARPPAGSP